MKILIDWIGPHTSKEHYDVYLGEKRVFKLRGMAGKFILTDERSFDPRAPAIQYFHTAHAALSRVIDELVPEGT